jgi:hypothetical protein
MVRHIGIKELKAYSMVKKCRICKVSIKGRKNTRKEKIKMGF